MLSSIIFWGASTPARSVSYTDSLFLVVSAMTLAGLNTINLSTLNIFQQFLLFLLILLGSAILVSTVVVHVRKKAFERRFKDIIEEERKQRRDRNSSSRRPSFGMSFSRSRPEVDGVVVRGRAIKSETHSAENVSGEAFERDGSTPPLNEQSSSAAENLPQQEAKNDDEAGNEKRLTIDSGITRRITFASLNSPARERQHGRIISMQGVGARQNLLNHPTKSPQPVYPTDLPNIDQPNLEIPPTTMPAQYGLSKGFIGRNSQFSSLSLVERERLGGVEYRAVTILSVIVPLYFVLWQLLGCISLGAYVASKRADTAEANGENPWYVSPVFVIVIPAYLTRS